MPAPTALLPHWLNHYRILKASKQPRSDIFSQLKSIYSHIFKIQFRDPVLSSPRTDLCQALGPWCHHVGCGKLAVNIYCFTAGFHCSCMRCTVHLEWSRCLLGHRMCTRRLWVGRHLNCCYSCLCNILVEVEADTYQKR